MAQVNRRVTYKLYPSASQAATLERLCELHRRLYNAALEERISAWRNGRHSVSFADQCKSLTQVRRDDPDYRALNAQSLQVTLKRLDKAMAAFFRRVKQGQAPGFPRFKPRDRFPGFGYKAHGDGFKFTPGEGWRHGRLRLSGVGDVRARGEARTPGRVVCCEVQKKADGWFLSLVVACEPWRERTVDREAGLDWGTETFATLGYDLDEVETIPNPRNFQAEKEALAEDGRALARKLRRGKKSARALKAKRRLARRHRKLANRRKDFLHQASAGLVRQHRLIATEKLTVANMTRSARGTVEEPGRNVAQKAGLNREILDTAPTEFLSMLAYKAEEAGCELFVADTRRVKPSQRDPVSWKVSKKALDERRHVLPDGRVIGRDHAAALVVLRAALEAAGREPTWVRAGGPETTARAA